MAMTNTPDKSEMEALERVERRLNNAWAKHGFMTLTVSDIREICERLRLAVRENTGWEPSMSVLERAADEAADLIQQQQATIEAELLNDIAVTMSEFVDNWPQPKKVSTALALIAKTLRTALGKDASNVRSQREGRGQ